MCWVSAFAACKTPSGSQRVAHPPVCFAKSVWKLLTGPYGLLIHTTPPSLPSRTDAESPTLGASRISIENDMAMHRPLLCTEIADT